MRFLVFAIFSLSLLSDVRAQLDTSKRPAPSGKDSIKAWTDFKGIRGKDSSIKYDAPSFLSYAGSFQNDTTLMRIGLKRGGALNGHILSVDSNWITFTDYNGLRQQLDAHMVTGIVNYRHFSDSVTKSRLEIASTPPLRSPQFERFETYLAPIAVAGATFPSSGEKSGFAASLGAIFGFRIPDFSFNYLGEFISIEVDSKSFTIDDNTLATVDHWSFQYFEVTPGLSYRGIFSAGISIGIPISANYTDYNTPGGFGYYRPFMASQLNMLLEPRVIVAAPLAVSYAYSRTLLLLVQAGYPLTPLFKEHSLEMGPLSSGTQGMLGSLRLPEISVGLSYVFSLTPSRGFVGTL